MPSSPVTIRSPYVYGPVLGLTLVTIGFGAGGHVRLGSTALIILAVAVVITGMPHGAIDHLVAVQLYDLSYTWTDRAKFYGGYLILMGLYAGLWLVAPVGSLVLFLVMTMYHFGQADLAYWSLPPLQARFTYLSRGLFLIGLPIAAVPELVDPIFTAIAGLQVSSWSLLSSHSASVVVGLIAQHAAVIVLAAWSHKLGVGKWGREFLNVAVLAPLFAVVHPLVAFSVYFGLWHSLGHILELLRFFRRHGSEPTTVAAFYREAALFTLLPFLALGVLYWTTQAFGRPEQMIALLFIIIAVMTLPHMIIVERLYRERERGREITA